MEPEPQVSFPILANKTSTSISKSYGIIVCNICEYGLLLKSVVRHMKTAHDQSISQSVLCSEFERENVIPCENEEDPRLLSLYSRPSKEVDPIEGAKTYSGFICEECFKCSTTEQTILKHCRDHKPKSTYKLCCLQRIPKNNHWTFFPVKNTKELPVPASKPTKSDITAATQQLHSNLKLAPQFNFVEMDLPNSKLHRETCWFEIIEKIGMDNLIELKSLSLLNSDENIEIYQLLKSQCLMFLDNVNKKLKTESFFLKKIIGYFFFSVNRFITVKGSGTYKMTPLL
jgi:hypothetical protein